MKRKIKDPIRAAKIAIEYLDGIELDDAQARHYLERVQRRLQMIVTGYRMKGRPSARAGMAKLVAGGPE